MSGGEGGYRQLEVGGTLRGRGGGRHGRQRGHPVRGVRAEKSKSRQQSRAAKDGGTPFQEAGAIFESEIFELRE